MTDLALVWNQDAWGADLALLGFDLATDEGLNTAVTISWFTDRRAPADAQLDTAGDNPPDPRGWWGDAFAAVDNDQIGSLFWLLQRSKELPPTLRQYEEYGRQALQWLIDDGGARAVAVSGTDLGEGWLQLSAAITKPDGKVHTFDKIWKALR